jgi:hypothetical protein
VGEDWRILLKYMFKKIGWYGVEWIRLAQISSGGRAFMNTVVDFWFYKNWDFLDWLCGCWLLKAKCWPEPVVGSVENCVLRFCMIQFTGACWTNIVTPSQMLRFVRTPILNEDGSACPSSSITIDPHVVWVTRSPSTWNETMLRWWYEKERENSPAESKIPTHKVIFSC